MKWIKIFLLAGITLAVVFFAQLVMNELCNVDASEYFGDRFWIATILGGLLEEGARFSLLQKTDGRERAMAFSLILGLFEAWNNSLQVWGSLGIAATLLVVVIFATRIQQHWILGRSMVERGPKWSVPLHLVMNAGMCSLLGLASHGVIPATNLWVIWMLVVCTYTNIQMIRTPWNIGELRWN
jgi:hypothetical protein